MSEAFTSRASLSRLAIYVSVVLWVAAAAGNVALFTIRPAQHWPTLETIEVLQAASLIPVALYLHDLNRSALSLALTAIAVAAILVQMLIGIGFATGVIAFGRGAIGGPIYIGTFLLLFAWMFVANALAWRRRCLPRWIAALGMAAAATATLLYPLWGISLTRTVPNNARQP
jgi:hypothetical protein